MAHDFAILVGTVGNGMYRSTDGGATFQWVMNGISCNDLVVRGLSADPHNPRHVIAATAIFDSGTDSLGTAYGLHESFDSGETWAPIEAFKGIECWRVTYDPKIAGRYYVGTRPANIYRTEDGGKSFAKLTHALPQTCWGIGLPRTTSIVLDPQDPDFIFVSIEIGGFIRSLDGGATWERVLNEVQTPAPNGAVFGLGGREDGHYSVLSHGNPDKLFASTPDGPYVSEDRGTTWADLPVSQIFPEQYHHDLTIKLDDPDTLFYGIGDNTVGTQGAMLRSRDRGVSWSAAPFPVKCNSPIWCFAQHPSNPERILTATHNGLLFGSENAGDSWVKYEREFTEVRAVCWLPN
jgi:photosystem II stability/assembly factor-like uncharacterized protein